MDDFDVVIVTDCRLPGGTVGSVVEEVAAQHHAGLRTGLVHVPSPLVSRARGFNPRLAALIDQGMARVALGDTVQAGLAVLRHPAVFTTTAPLPRLDVDRTLMVVNQTPQDLAGGLVFYDVAEMRRTVEGRIGGDVGYVPIGPLVRDAVSSVAPDLPLEPHDWVNIIDVDRWAVDPARRFHRSRPWIGRHSRDDPKKWPHARAHVLGAYPPDPSVEVRVLGGGRAAADVVGRLPDNWTVLPFGSVDPAVFLAQLDAWVYFHHPEWVESFGRTILEAMASGVPMILPEHFRVLFGDAPRYAEPADVLDTVLLWRDDPGPARERAADGQEHVRRSFSHHAHVERLRPLLSGTRVDRDPVFVPGTQGRTRHAGRRILFVSSNGAGVGHLMRLMAMARRADPAVEPLFLTLSQAVSVVNANGFLTEYLMSRSYGDFNHQHWHRLLRARLHEIIDTHDVEAIVFDGTWPYQGLIEALDDHPHVRAIWSRRGMWRPSIIDTPALATSGRFDLVLEPGEFAEAFDHGVTARRRHEVTHVAPITFLDPDEVIGREQACAELGIDPGRPAALVQLGAGNIDDTASLSGIVIRRLLREPDLQVCVTRSVISAGDDAPVSDRIVHLRGIYPLARCFRAFDLAVAASGYNSFHELVAAGVPTLFVPNVDTSTDDQAARGRYAAAAGVALAVDGPDPAAVAEALDRLVDEETRRAIAGAARSRYPGNGAEDAMAAIQHTIGIGNGPVPGRPTSDTGSRPSTPINAAPPTAVTTTAPGPSPAPGTADPRRAARALVAGLVAGEHHPRLEQVARRAFYALPAGLRRGVRRRLVRAGHLDAVPEDHRVPVPPGPRLPPDECEGLDGLAIVLGADLGADRRHEVATRFAELQVVHRDIAPLVVTFTDDLGHLRSLGLPVEVIATHQAWTRLEPGEAWAAYVRRRLAHLLEVYAIARVVVVGEPPPLPDSELLAVVARSYG